MSFFRGQMFFLLKKTNKKNYAIIFFQVFPLKVLLTWEFFFAKSFVIGFLDPYQIYIFFIANEKGFLFAGPIHIEVLGFKRTFILKKKF